VACSYLGASADTHEVIWTGSATAALRLLAESYTVPQQADGERAFFLLDRNHTSVVGMREVLADKGFRCISVAAERCCRQASLAEAAAEGEAEPSSPSLDTALFAFPAQCNYSGQRFPLGWVQEARDGHLLQDSSGRRRRSRVSRLPWLYPRTLPLGFPLLSSGFGCA
jgi:molybdenum cofactor sulfurtransferase